jgi:hypothetical protein
MEEIVMRHICVEFSKSGWRRFAEMNRGFGAHFIRGFILCRETSAYIEAHEEQGIVLDATCQEIHYDCGIYMLLMKRHGVWYITEIWTANAPTMFVPVYLWQKIKLGWQDFIARVLIGWRVAAASRHQNPEVIL